MDLTLTDKKVLRVAKRVQAGKIHSQADLVDAASVLAQAAVERLTPVEIKLLPGATRGVCECEDLPEYDARFCEDCGRPIKWLNEPTQPLE